MNNDRFTSHSWPKISVVTPSYNQGKYIEETIASVLGQNYPNLEYIIIDGGSTDDSTEIISRYEDRLHYFVSEPDNGQSHAINKGFSQASGDILCWLNSDDQFAPHALWYAALAFMTNTCDLVAGICEVYNEGVLAHRHFTSCANVELSINDLLDLDNGWNAGQFFYQPEVFFSRDLWLRSGGYVNEQCYYSMDYELWCRFAINDASLLGIGVPLVHFRAHEEQKTAAESAFKSELVKVRDQFVSEKNLQWKDSVRPKVNWLRKLKVALINDLGYKYGAGVAQLRIAGAFDLAGQEVAIFDLLSFEDGPQYKSLLSKLEEFAPDLVIFGNIHAVQPDNIDVLESVEKHYPTYWLTHDFWLFTGRCPYTNGCTKFESGCDEQCPTKKQYPAIKEQTIATAWQQKQDFLRNSRQLTVLANSKWSSSKAHQATAAFPNVGVESISLGAPVDVFQAGDKSAAKNSLGISAEHFVIALSVSSISDERKGGAILIEALKYLNKDKLTLLLIGRVDQALDIESCELVQTGYIEDTEQLVNTLNAADLYVGPSREETFGQVFVEAALCGVPSIGFAGSGVEDAIKHQVTGILVDELTPAALAKAMSNLMSNSEQYQQLVLMAPLYARAFFSLEASYRSFFNVFEKQGLIDEIGVAHKIAFSAKSKLIQQQSQGWAQLTFLGKVNVIARRGADKVIGLLPGSLTTKVRQALPKPLERLIMTWLLGR